MIDCFSYCWWLLSSLTILKAYDRFWDDISNRTPVFIFRFISLVFLKRNNIRGWPEERKSQAGVDEIVAGIGASYVGEPERAFRINCHSRRIDGLDKSFIFLLDPLNGGFGPAIRWLTSQTEWRAFLCRQRHRRFFFEWVEVRLASEHGIRCCHSELVRCKTLILAYNKSITNSANGQNGRCQILEAN